MKKVYEAPNAEIVKFTTAEATNDTLSVPGNVTQTGEIIHSDNGWV